MEKINWKVEGMTCSNCALTISRFLEKKGLDNIQVNPISGELSFNAEKEDILPSLKKGIETLGYKIQEPDHLGHHHSSKGAGLLGNNKKRFLLTLPFTAALMLPMLGGHELFHWLMQPLTKLILCLPVFATGMYYFGRSAYKSLRNGIPNMDALITLGSLAAFIYSLSGMAMGLGDDYLFFETTATIINLVFLGNYLEEASVQSTQKALKALAASQKVMANMIAFDSDHKEQIFPIDNSQLKTGDLVLIRSGEKVPADCKILWGDCEVNESIITGESIPLSRTQKDPLIGGSILEAGTVKAQVTAAGDKTVLAGILQMVKSAQSEKPPVQKLADRISAVFVPVVIGLALLTFLINYFLLDQDASHSLLRSIAVLVISCPCAMGIATPAGIAVGLGRAARSGILFRKSSALESFKKIQQVVFDKTGTLTTGKFEIANFHATGSEIEFKQVLFSLEQYSTHPIAKAICNAWKTNDTIKWTEIKEIKGSGVEAKDANGNVFLAGSFKILPAHAENGNHNIYVLKNGQPFGWVDLKDEIRPEAISIINWLHAQQIKTILLSGDKKENCLIVAKELGISEVMAEQSPAEKMEQISRLTAIAPTAMVGDGINDAPAMARATLGISVSDATQIAMQNADVVLMNNGLKQLPLAMGLGRHTYITIRQNLFWAFFYNIIAIPIAALGLLNPMLAALVMGFSDVVLAFNSIRLFIKKVM